jgi:hypothetical protein
VKAALAICLLLLSSPVALSADRPPPVFLNHVWIALDQATYEALRTSSRVAGLGGVKEQKVVAGSENWAGFYWTGRQTYMEFFGAAALPDETLLGDCGIGLYVETRGGTAAVAERLRTVFGDKVQIEEQVRTTPTGDIPWYTATHTSAPRKTAVWVMELDPGYLAARHPGTLIKDPLSRQQERSWDYRPDQVLDNVVGLTLALDQESASELATELGLFGWSVQRTGAGFLAAGPQVKIRVVPASARSGIQQIELRLRRPATRQAIRLGNAELDLAGTAGRLVFWK